MCQCVCVILHCRVDSTAVKVSFQPSVCGSSAMSAYVLLIMRVLVLAVNRLRWYGHVLRKDDDDWVKKCMDYEV